MKWYGSVNNRLGENNQRCETIEVGTAMTSYSYSDRHVYEVIAVRDQKHVTVRPYDAEPVGKPMTNNWKLVSNPENFPSELAKRGNYWYSAKTMTLVEYKSNMASDDFGCRIYAAQFDEDKLKKNGKQTKYERWNVSFGVADQHYDYGF